MLLTTTVTIVDNSQLPLEQIYLEQKKLARGMQKLAFSAEYLANYRSQPPLHARDVKMEQFYFIEILI